MKQPVGCRPASDRQEMFKVIGIVWAVLSFVNSAFLVKNQSIGIFVPSDPKKEVILELVVADSFFLFCSLPLR